MEQQKIPVGIGVHAGIAYFGSMSTAEGLTDISAKGDEVNMAARLASKALKTAGIEGDDLEARSLELKGIREQVPVRVMHSTT